jgi:hypothetical protein
VAEAIKLARVSKLNVYFELKGRIREGVVMARPPANPAGTHHQRCPRSSVPASGAPVELDSNPAVVVAASALRTHWGTLMAIASRPGPTPILMEWHNVTALGDCECTRAAL